MASRHAPRIYYHIQVAPHCRFRIAFNLYTRNRRLALQCRRGMVTVNVPSKPCPRYTFYAKAWPLWTFDVLQTMLENGDIEETEHSTDEKRHFRFIAEEWIDAIDELYRA